MWSGSESYYVGLVEGLSLAQLLFAVITFTLLVIGPRGPKHVED